MSEQIDAIYDGGVLRPVAPLALPDQTRVTLTVDVPSNSNRAQGPVADFEAELDQLVFDGPSLPPDFSRADIYADHD